MTELAYSRLKVIHPLGWDVLDSLKLLSDLLEKFGGIIDFTGSDLAEGQLSDGLCNRRWTAASLIGVGRSIPTYKVVYRFVGGLRLQSIQLVLIYWCSPYCHLGRERACGGVVKIIGRSKNWSSEGQTATGTMARCTLTSHYTTMQ